MMSRKKIMRMPNRKKMIGQSFVEYLVVLTMGVIILVTGDDPPIQKLASAIHEYYTDYSYAISISSMPNCFNSASAGPVTVNVDKCIDLQNPEWPVDVSFN